MTKEETENTNSMEHTGNHRHVWNCLLKVVIFSLLFIILFQYVTKVMSMNTIDTRQYTLMTGIYEEEKDSLDAVYIGSSNCYAFWNPLVAFEEYGICVLPYNCSSLPLNVAEYMIREARKTQPDAVYLININSIDEEEISDVVMHRLLDYMPFSLNKLELTKYMTELSELSLKDSMEYYFPIIKYHGRWNELTPENFEFDIENHKNSSSYNGYLKKVKNISSDYKTTSEQQLPSDVVMDSLESLLDYCDEEKVKAVFVTVPQARKGIAIVEKYNAMNEIIASRGYQVVDLLNNIDETSLDLETDFYNAQHTNIHGSVKFTQYMSEYLIDTFGFEDKRDDSQYESWNEELEKYQKKVAPYMFDFEWDSTSRDYELSAVENLACESTENENVLSWDFVEGADGYAIYCKNKEKKAWTLLAEVTGNSYTDQQISAEECYTVVPFKESNDGKKYGKFPYFGIKADS